MPGSGSKESKLFRVERGRTSNEARAMDSWGQSRICTARHDPQEIGRSPFWAQRSRSQIRSLVTGGEEGGRKSGNSLCVESHQCLAQEHEKGFKAARLTCWGCGSPSEKAAENLFQPSADFRPVRDPCVFGMMQFVPECMIVNL
jgi:hypothetical protein